MDFFKMTDEEHIEVIQERFETALEREDYQEAQHLANVLLQYGTEP